MIIFEVGKAHGEEVGEIGGRQWNRTLLESEWFRKAFICKKAPLYMVQLQKQLKSVVGRNVGKRRELRQEGCV